MAVEGRININKIGKNLIASTRFQKSFWLSLVLEKLAWCRKDNIK